MYSCLTDVSAATGYSGTTQHNTQSNPTLLAAVLCDGARVPPENGGLGYNVPPGIADATVPNPIFNLTGPAATVDEGNNWINNRLGSVVAVESLDRRGRPVPSPTPASATTFRPRVP